MRKHGIYFSSFLIIFFFISARYAVTPYKFPRLLHFPAMPVSAANPVTLEGADLGRHLFYDPVLSSDSTLSCAGCHKQSYAFSDSPNEFSKGRNGAIMPRNTMALFNLAWYPSFFWDGMAATIEEQISHPLKASTEMNMNWSLAAVRLSRNKLYKKMFMNAFGNQTIDSVTISKAIAQFLRTLISNQSKYDNVLAGKARFTKDEFAGYMLVNDQTKGDCLHCHTTDANTLGTTLNFSNNGLDEIPDPQNYKDKGRGGVTGNLNDNGKFIIPSLRNVLLTAPYMHDGRFKTLEDVLDFYSSGVKQCANIDSKMEFAHRGGAHLSSDEKEKIISFLKTMTDSVFISKKEFASPF
jgi:cytochrome c peroxidase